MKYLTLSQLTKRQITFCLVPLLLILNTIGHLVWEHKVESGLPDLRETHDSIVNSVTLAQSRAFAVQMQSELKRFKAVDPQPLSYQSQIEALIALADSTPIADVDAQLSSLEHIRSRLDKSKLERLYTIYKMGGTYSDLIFFWWLFSATAGVVSLFLGPFIWIFILVDDAEFTP